jgi:hypothetical protein
MKTSQLMSSQNFIAIATIDAIVLLAEKGGINSADLMKELISGANEKLTARVREMVELAAKVTAEAL